MSVQCPDCKRTGVTAKAIKHDRHCPSLDAKIGSYSFDPKTTTIERPFGPDGPVVIAPRKNR